MSLIIMSSYVHLGLLVLLVMIPATIGHGGGAPSSACVDMTPSPTGHGAGVQKTASPYSLEVDGDMTSGSKTLKGKIYFGSV